MASLNIVSTWTFIKDLKAAIGVKLHYTENAIEYRIFTINGQIVYETHLFKDSSTIVLDDPVQNDTDLTDWEANFKPSANPLEIIDVNATLVANQNINVDIGLVEDDPHVSGEKGPLVLGVRNDADADLTDTDLDRSPIATTKEGWIKTKIEDGIHKVGCHKLVRWDAGSISVGPSTWTDTYVLTGPATFYGAIFHLNTDGMDFRVIVDGSTCIDVDLKEMKEDFVLKAGGGGDDSDSESGGGGRSVGCIGLREYDNKRWAYCPPNAIRVNTELKIQMKSQSGTKTIYRALTSLAE